MKWKNDSLTLMFIANKKINNDRFAFLYSYGPLFSDGPQNSAAEDLDVPGQGVRQVQGRVHGHLR